MERRIIHTPLAPEAIGPYNQAVVSGGLVFTAGQIPLDPKTGKLINGDFKRQVDQVLHNLNAILSAAGSDLSKAVKLTVFLTDLGQFALLNEVFSERFSGSEYPARSVVEVSALPLGAAVEIECVAAL
ncbi:MAG: RidA family protein [FCB group bacterium]|nr:RidA family protein [FCB group bacterium]